MIRHLVVALLGALWLAPLSAAQAPARLMRDVTAEKLAFSRLHVVDAYKRVGSRDPKWDDDAIAFLEEICLWFAGSPDRAPLLTLATEADRLVTELECNDGLVVYGRGYIWDQLDHDNRAYRSLGESQERLAEQEYSFLRRAHAASRYALFMRAKELDEERVTEYLQYAADAVVEAVRAGEFEGYEEQIIDSLYVLIVRDLPTRMARQMIERLSEFDEELVPAWVANYLRGRIEVRTAWDKRGSGSANTVDEDGWRGFGDHLAAAGEYLKESWRLNPSSPWAATAMISVVMGGAAAPDETETLWHERATDAVFDWQASYSAVLWALRPRWGGDHESMLAFGQTCVDTDRFDTIVPYFYVDALCDIASDLAQRSAWRLEYWTLPEAASLADTVLERLAAHPAHAYDMRRYTTMRIAIAWANDDMVKARALLASIDNDLDTKALADTNMLVKPHIILEDVALARTDARDLAERAQSAWQTRDFDASVAAFEQLVTMAGDDALLKRVAMDKLAAVDLSRRLATGEWVDIAFDADLSGWTPLLGSWSMQNASTVRAEIGWDDSRTKGLGLALDVGVGPRFEIEGRVDMRDILAGRWPNFALLSSWDLWAERWHSVSFYPRDNKVAHKFKFFGSDLTDVEFGPEFSFRVRIWDGDAVVYVDDEQVIAGPFLGRAHRFENGQIGFGAWTQNMHGSMLISDLRIRLLDAQPAELGDSAPY